MAHSGGNELRLVLRLRIARGVRFSDAYTAMSEAGGDIVAMDVHHVAKEYTVRDVTVSVRSDEDGQRVIQALRDLDGIEIVHASDRTFLVHLGGKIGTHLKVPVKNRDDLSMVYTPGVARVCQAIHQDPSKAFQLTIKRNTIAVVTDGSAVLGLGNIGPRAALPVMEGKAMLFKQFADVDAFPICLDTQDTEEIIRMVKGIAPVFGGINLEDISSPRCFEIEERLRQELDIPVFHDDQHGTAVVMLAGLLNALKIVGKQMADLHVVMSGVGAAGVACTKILLASGVGDVIGCDRSGIIEPGHTYDNPIKQWYAENTNRRGMSGTLADAIRGADVFIGVSGPGVLTVDHLKTMAENPIVFAMANPIPEILPEEAEPYVRVMATGRSDYPNQINNVLCFPGIFRGALDVRAREINEEMKLAAARAIAACVPEEQLNEQYIIPSVFNPHVVESVRKAVAEAAVQTGVARRDPPVDSLEAASVHGNR
ncbi:MAG: NAD-dependent malic enzyme [Alicyclobacillus herbarius]|uniref:NAD-dependent malic enzyme n=1 Tax=Alicyclobacillus herbarius TaxID=122960 RepID=UPI002352FD84|nr:NAD-dependent malic enzyme [Alicyclobacillus herbarius]MCL6631904.1 NAD-dependent malic enzyme [Alicyclobacillus herbarius]